MREFVVIVVATVFSCAVSEIYSYRVKDFTILGYLEKLLLTAIAAGFVVMVSMTYFGAFQ